jgi:hypothetical protein
MALTSRAIMQTKDVPQQQTEQKSESGSCGIPRACRTFAAIQTMEGWWFLQSGVQVSPRIAAHIRE